MDSRLVLLIVLFLALLGGCRRSPSAPPRFSASIGPEWFTQDGAAAVPASAASKTTTTAATIPPGVQVTAHPDGSITWTTVAPLAVVATVREASATGPAAFAPPAPPSPTDEADGKARLFAWLAVGLGAIAAGFGFSQGWTMLGLGGACVAAAGVAVIALSRVPGWIWGLGGVGLAVAAFGVLWWHLVLKPRPGAALTPAVAPA